METTTIDSIVCIATDIHLWTGRKQLTQKDLKKVDVADLPPEDLASLGSKKICDPKLVNQFEAMKRAAERLILEAGYRLWGIYALPEDKVADVVRQLKDIQQEFNDCKAQFIADYDRSIEQWVNAHPEWASIIQSAVTPVEEVERKLCFGYRVFRITPAPVEDGVDEGTSMLEDSYQAILKEVSQSAGEIWDSAFKGRSRVRQSSVARIEPVREKLNGLSFIDARIFPIVSQIDAALSACPKEGYVTGGALQGLNSLLLLLSDTERMTAHGEAAIQIATGELVDAEDESEAVAESDSDTAGETAEVVESVETVDEEPPAKPVAPPKRQHAPSRSGLFF